MHGNADLCYLVHVLVVRRLRGVGQGGGATPVRLDVAQRMFLCHRGRCYDPLFGEAHGPTENEKDIHE